MSGLENTKARDKMKAIMVMYDSLRRDLLPCCGDDLLAMPNFRRLEERTAVFDNAYVCSLPCMPARKELHTGRPNFLHRSWGPLEPFEDSMPELLRQAGVHTHLSTDHYHYLQDGGATYQDRYSTWECFRGQESDSWVGCATPPAAEFAPCVLGGENLSGPLRAMRGKGSWQNTANRSRQHSEADYPQTHTFDGGLKFICANAQQDNWFVQIETFDPHEPFDAPKGDLDRWFDPDDPFAPDWPPYAPVREDQETVGKMRKKYYALMEFCDRSLGRVLDVMDELDLWKDTMLIVNTDHGFFLGEHQWWGKGCMPDYQELVHVPLFIWDPRCRKQGVRRNALVQTIDLAPTLLDYFGVDIPVDMTGRPLAQTVAEDAPVREYAMLGYFGGPVTITDGRFLLMRAVSDPGVPVYEYTTMPTHMKTRFAVEEMRQAQLAPPFSFTKNCPLLRIPPQRVANANKITKDLLFDLQADPGQRSPIADPQVHERLLGAIREQFCRLDAPEEQFARYGVDK